jgi:hypothetical protein
MHTFVYIYLKNIWKFEIFRKLILDAVMGAAGTLARLQSV